MDMNEEAYKKPIELRVPVDRETAEEVLRILNWFFDGNPDYYLIQKPRTVHDGNGNERTTVRYQIKQKTQNEEEKISE